MKYASYWDPGTVRGQRYRAAGRYSAFRHLVRYPPITSLLMRDMLPGVVGHVVADGHVPAGTPPDRDWHDVLEADIERALAGVPGVQPWRWLVEELAQFVVMLALHVAPSEVGDLLRRGRSVDEWIASDELTGLIDDALLMEREDAKSQRHLTRTVEVTPLNEHFLRAGRGVDLTHEMIDAWAKTAHTAVEAAASEPVPKPTRKRWGNIERWVGWWYRHEVLEQSLRSIVASDYGADHVGSNTSYVGRQVGLVRELLDEDTTEPSSM